MLGLRGGAEVVVATPGRLLDLVGRHAVKLDDVELLVLDEADRLLDEGFADELGRLTALLPPQRQALFFSATFPPAVQQLAGTLALHEPVRVDAPDTADGGRPDITQRAIEVDEPKRTPLLRHLIGQADWQRVLVFVATRYATQHVADKLRRHGIPAAAFHGELSQGARTRVLNELQRGQVRVVVATDMAARGLHIADLPVVVNYDLPRSPADHTHRIGRTARAGASGLAISFITPASEPHFRLIEKRQGARVERERVEGFEPVGPGQGAEGSAAVGTGGVKGKRKSKKDKLREAASKAAGL
jgi:ATP-dependent RNA helicase RhlE